MKLIKVSKDCYYTTATKESDRPTLGYIRGNKYSLMIDAGTSKYHVSKYNKIIIEEGLKKPNKTLITHWHWDHSFGINALESKSIALKLTQDKLIEMSEWEWTDQAMKLRLERKEDIEFADTNIRKEYSDLSEIKVSLADVVFEDEIIFDLGDKKVIAKHVESPHSNDCVIVYVPSDKVVYVADAISVDYYNDNYLDKDKMLSLHKYLESLDFEICVTGHNNHFEREKTLSVTKRLSTN